jgi:hypothetical protein
MAIELTKTYCIYQAQTKLLELGVEVAEARNWNKPDIQAKIDLGIKIRMWLKALQYSDYLETQAVNRLVYTLANLANVNAIPYAPVVTTVSTPAILIGGTTNVTNNYYTDATNFSAVDIEAETSIGDSFSYTLSNGVRWEYTLINNAGTALRKGSFSTGWLSDGSDIDDGSELSTADIGDTSGVTLSTDINAGNVRLLVTATSDNWRISGKRYLD